MTRSIATGYQQAGFENLPTAKSSAHFAPTHFRGVTSTAWLKSKITFDNSGVGQTMGYGETSVNVCATHNHPKTIILSDNADSETSLETIGLKAALIRLKTAFEFAKSCAVDCWEFAIELEQLQHTGVTSEEIRWLLKMNLIEHAEEATTSSEEKRRFEEALGLRLSSRSCFVVNRKGMAYIEQLTSLRPAEVKGKGEDKGLDASAKPVWDGIRHELRLGPVLVKKFKWRAANQEAILMAFQEDGWPAHIYDPLKPQAEINPKRRLSDAIKCLNRKQVCPKIRFVGDGTGQGVLWEIR